MAMAALALIDIRLPPGALLLQGNHWVNEYHKTSRLSFTGATTNMISGDIIQVSTDDAPLHGRTAYWQQKTAENLVSID